MTDIAIRVAAVNRAVGALENAAVGYGKNNGRSDGWPPLEDALMKARREVREAVDALVAAPKPETIALKFIDLVRNRLYDGRGRLRYAGGTQLSAALAHGHPMVTVDHFDEAFGPPPDVLGDLLDAYERAIREVDTGVQRVVGEASMKLLVDAACAAREAVRTYAEEKEP